MPKITVLFKWVGIFGGLIASVNILGVAVYLFVEGSWNSVNFLRFLLLALILEGLIMALIGCLSFFGFEKYRSWLKEEEKNRGEQPGSDRKLIQEDKSKPDIGLFFLTLGILLFLIAFGCFSLIF